MLFWTWQVIPLEKKKLEISVVVLYLDAIKSYNFKDVKNETNLEREGERTELAWNWMDYTIAKDTSKDVNGRN